jgi:hypothetical protein
MTTRAEMIGVKFGRLTPVEVVGKGHVHLIYRCKCECGNEISVKGNSLRSGNTKSCGCIRRPNLVGLETEQVTVLSKVRNQIWLVRCKSCGGTHEQNQREIRRGAQILGCEKYKPHNHSGLEKQDLILRNGYGISLETYKEMLAKQGGGCAICGAVCDSPKVPNRRLSVDHCHSTKQVRGILCAHCNQGLGHFKDNPSLLVKASQYLTNAR